MPYQPNTPARRKNSAWRHKTRAKLYAAQDGKCYWCSKKLLLYPDNQASIRKPNRQMEIDHIMCVCIGGSHSLSNLAGSCKQCNLARANWFEKSRHKFIIIDSLLSYHQMKVAYAQINF